MWGLDLRPNFQLPQLGWDQIELPKMHPAERELLENLRRVLSFSFQSLGHGFCQNIVHRRPYCQLGAAAAAAFFHSSLAAGMTLPNYLVKYNLFGCGCPIPPVLVGRRGGMLSREAVGESCQWHRKVYYEIACKPATLKIKMHQRHSLLFAPDLIQSNSEAETIGLLQQKEIIQMHLKSKPFISMLSWKVRPQNLRRWR